MINAFFFLGELKVYARKLSSYCPQGIRKT